MTDITIPAHEAKNLADFLRRQGIGEHHPLIRTLDPPAPSLRDEVIEAVRVAAEWSNYYGTGKVADAVLALMLERVLNLPRIEWGEGGWHVRLDDLIALFEEAR